MYECRKTEITYMSSQSFFAELPEGIYKDIQNFVAPL